MGSISGQELISHMPGSRKSENITTKQYCNKFNTLQKNLIKKEIDSLILYFNFIPQFPYLHTHTPHTHTHTHTHIFHQAGKH